MFYNLPQRNNNFVKYTIILINSLTIGSPLMLVLSWIELNSTNFTINYYRVISIWTISIDFLVLYANTTITNLNSLDSLTTNTNVEGPKRPTDSQSYTWNWNVIFSNNIRWSFLKILHYHSTSVLSHDFSVRSGYCDTMNGTITPRTRSLTRGILFLYVFVKKIRIKTNTFMVGESVILFSLNYRAIPNKRKLTYLSIL